jgi:dTDP-glucose 4,6-dehydratase
MDVWLVTGGAGFIGSNFVRLALARTPVRIVVLDKLTYAGNLESLDQTLREHRPTAILNFAAESHVDRSIDGPAAFVQTNVVGCFTLLEAARRHLAGLDAATRARFRFLHVSTDEVYGSLGPDGAFSEASPYDPRSPYAATKAAADHLVRAYAATYALPVLITNCSNNYGPYQYPEKLVPLMILNALDGRELPVYGDGGNVRDWIYVEDHCSGILRVLEAGEPGERYNVGANEERTNLELVQAICSRLELVAPAAANPRLLAAGAARYADLVRFVPDRPGHDRRYAIDASRIRRELGWRPAHDLGAGLDATVRWYLEHRDWCESVQAGSYRRERLGLG